MAVWLPEQPSVVVMLRSASTSVRSVAGSDGLNIYSIAPGSFSVWSGMSIACHPRNSDLIVLLPWFVDHVCHFSACTPIYCPLSKHYRSPGKRLRFHPENVIFTTASRPPKGSALANPAPQSSQELEFHFAYTGKPEHQHHYNFVAIPDHQKLGAAP